MIGQEALQQKLNSYTLQTLPRTLLFLGESGCGKHTIVKMLADRLNLPLVNIDDKADIDSLVESMIEYQQDPIKKLYLIDLTKFTDKAQTKFLKFIEEPSDNVYIALIAETELTVLPTILNRCIKLYFAPYTLDQLKQLTWLSASLDDLVYKVCRTPGKLLSIDIAKIHELYDLCYKVITKAGSANYANLLSVSSQINYKEDYNKHDFITFFDMLSSVAYEVYLAQKLPIYLEIYKTINKYKQQLVITANLQKENFVISFLDALWRITH